MNEFNWSFFSFSTVDDIPEHYFKQKKTITGKVITVHDGDGFRLFHDEEKGFFSCFSSHKATFKRGIKIFNYNCRKYFH